MAISCSTGRTKRSGPTRGSRRGHIRERLGTRGDAWQRDDAVWRTAGPPTARPAGGPAAPRRLGARPGVWARRGHAVRGVALRVSPEPRGTAPRRVGSHHAMAPRHSPARRGHRARGHARAPGPISRHPLRRRGGQRGARCRRSDLRPLSDLRVVRRERRRSDGGPGLSRRLGGGRDRKSTRLNSSHVKNSYAVFCLKKKKKNKTRILFYKKKKKKKKY